MYHSFGDRLVVVAVQEARNHFLGGGRCDTLKDLALTSYIVLERIGRARELGEVTQGKHGLSRLNIPPKSAFYFRKCLLADRFIVKQVKLNSKPTMLRFSDNLTVNSQYQ